MLVQIDDSYWVAASRIERVKSEHGVTVVFLVDGVQVATQWELSRVLEQLNGRR